MFTEIYNEICSEEQMELCKKLGLLSNLEQQQLEKAFIDNNQTKIIEWIIKLEKRYNHYLKSQSIRKQNQDIDRIQYLDKVQYLASLQEEYGEAHQDLSDLIQALRKLRMEWKNRKKDIENIILSILSSSPSKSYQLIKVNKSNLHILGLGTRSIGKHYILFEGELSTGDRQRIINQIAQDFTIVFQENIAQNLTSMTHTFPHIFQDQQVDILNELNNLSQKLCLSPPLHTPYLESRNSILSFNNKASPTLFNVPDPHFELKEWDHILHYKRPRARPGNWSLPPSHSGLWSTSISKLADQFTKVVESYYSNMITNARVMFSQRSLSYEYTTDSLMNIYRAIQLEKGCANLNKSLYKLQCK